MINRVVNNVFVVVLCSCSIEVVLESANKRDHLGRLEKFLKFRRFDDVIPLSFRQSSPISSQKLGIIILIYFPPNMLSTYNIILLISN